MMQLDHQLTRFLFEMIPHTRALDIFFLALSAVGTFSLLWLVLAVLMILVEEIRHPQFIRVFLAGVILTVFVVYGLKGAVRRDRPTPPTGLIRVEDYSFPSAHAAYAFYGATILYHFHSQTRRSKKSKKRLNLGRFNLFPWVVFGMAVLVSYSRIYLGVHYLTDVVAGAIIGFIIAKILVDRHIHVRQGAQKGKGRA